MRNASPSGVPIFIIVIAAILIFDVAFVALRMWATRPRVSAVARPLRPPLTYAAIVAKEYPGRRHLVRR